MSASKPQPTVGKIDPLRPRPILFIALLLLTVALMIGLVAMYFITVHRVAPPA